MTGIMPHTDGPLYHPYVTVLSLGCPVIFKLYKDWEAVKSEKQAASILIEPESMFIFTDDFYKEYLHAIDDIKEETVKIELKMVFLEENENEKETFWRIELCGSSVDNLE